MYEFVCKDCRKITYLSCSIKEYDRLKPQQICCKEQMEPVITGGRSVFLRDSFPKGTAIVEHAVEGDPPFCRDKAQLKDICAENGTVSRFVEDDM